MGQVLQNSPQPLFCASGCAIDFQITDKRERVVRLDCLLSMQEPWNSVIQEFFVNLGKLGWNPDRTILYLSCSLKVQWESAACAWAVTGLAKTVRHDTWLNFTASPMEDFVLWAVENKEGGNEGHSLFFKAYLRYSISFNPCFAFML